MQVVLASEFPVDADMAERTRRPFQPWREGGRGGQRSFSVQRPATNRLPSPFGSPARPRQIDKDLSECPTVICHSLRHTFLNLSTYSDNFKGAFIHWTLCNAISRVFLDSHNLIGLIS